MRDGLVLFHPAFGLVQVAYAHFGILSLAGLLGAAYHLFPSLADPETRHGRFGPCGLCSSYSRTLWPTFATAV